MHTPHNIEYICELRNRAMQSVIDLSRSAQQKFFTHLKYVMQEKNVQSFKVIKYILKWPKSFMRKIFSYAYRI